MPILSTAGKHIWLCVCRNIHALSYSVYYIKQCSPYMDHYGIFICTIAHLVIGFLSSFIYPGCDILLRNQCLVFRKAQEAFPTRSPGPCSYWSLELLISLCYLCYLFCVYITSLVVILGLYSCDHHLKSGSLNFPSKGSTSDKRYTVTRNVCWFLISCSCQTLLSISALNPL